MQEIRQALLRTIRTATRLVHEIKVDHRCRGPASSRMLNVATAGRLRRASRAATCAMQDVSRIGISGLTRA